MSCSASSSHSSSYRCEKSFDGRIGNEWRTKNEGIGAWIILNLGNTYQLENIRIKHANSHPHMFKDISLEFADGTKVDYKLNSVQNEWNTIILTNRPSSSYVKILVKSVYDGTSYPGFSEIRMYGCKMGN